MSAPKELEAGNPLPIADAARRRQTPKAPAECRFILLGALRLTPIADKSPYRSSSYSSHPNSALSSGGGGQIHERTCRALIGCRRTSGAYTKSRRPRQHRAQRCPYRPQRSPYRPRLREYLAWTRGSWTLQTRTRPAFRHRMQQRVDQSRQTLPNSEQKQPDWRIGQEGLVDQQ